MSSYALPFPGRDLAEKELSYDPCYPRIPEADRARIVDAAWEKGCAAARDVFAQSGGSAEALRLRQRENKHPVRQKALAVPGVFDRRMEDDSGKGSGDVRQHETQQRV